MMRSLCMLVCLSWALASWSAPLSSSHYDLQIRKAAGLYMPGVDWRIYKAQLYQESLLDPTAVSPVGAQGVAQFMPGTWRQVSRELGYEGLSPHTAEVAIPAGAYYMGRLRAQWSSPRPDADRHSLALASYNAGLGNLVKAQRACGGVLLYKEIAQCLPQITGRHSEETLTYVRRIWDYAVRLIVGVS